MKITTWPHRCVMIALALSAGLSTIAPVAGQNQATRSLRAIEAIDGSSIKLDGDILRLAGIEVPLASDGRYAQTWAERSRQALQTLSAGKLLKLSFVEAGRDRYSRLLAQASDDNGLWLQGEMLRNGLARVWTPSLAPERLQDMLKLENDARLAKRGLWSDSCFSVLGADASDRRHLDRFQIV